MWSYEHTVEADIDAAAVWRTWADIDEWIAWNPDIEHLTIDGPFAVGAAVTMTPRGQAPVQLRIVDLVEPERFVDEAQLAGVIIRTLHQVEPVGARRARITYRTEITGSEAVASELGPAITADFPQTMLSLVDHIAAQG